MRSEHTPQKPLPVPDDFGTKLEHWIDSGVWPEGGLLPTRDELAMIFGASDLDHAHEVLDGLHRRGILTTRPEDGRVVIGVKGGAQDSSTLAASQGTPGPDGDRWHLVSETRRALLTQAARLAATRASTDRLARLSGLLTGGAERTDDAEDTGLRGEHRGAGREDFEREVIVASGNDLMLRIYDRLMILEAMTQTAETATTIDSARIQFARRELLRAITTRQPKAAALLADRIP
ncbi:FadR/GntR family transcriptional regulator [Arthrobacter sp. RCC_34]|uniref:FadR/GntR family transcriptional regulator n=1 Tax=Arthrobacter sp. RCC_34 TaxID=3239230 RepID=UPI003524CB63